MTMTCSGIQMKGLSALKEKSLVVAFSNFHIINILTKVDFKPPTT
jgi:hypothetical protein